MVNKLGSTCDYVCHCFINKYNIVNIWLFILVNLSFWGILPSDVGGISLNWVTKLLCYSPTLLCTLFLVSVIARTLCWILVFCVTDHQTILFFVLYFLQFSLPVKPNSSYLFFLLDKFILENLNRRLFAVRPDLATNTTR